MVENDILENSPSRALDPGSCVRVMVFAPLEQGFDYLVGEEALSLGDVVEVPFGAGLRKGVVWEAVALEMSAQGKLKTIKRRLNYPPMQDNMRQFLRIMSEYTITPLGLLLAMAYRTREAKAPKPNALVGVKDFAGNLTPKRRALFEALIAQDYLLKDEINASPAIIKALVDVGAAHWDHVKSATIRSDGLRPELSPEQAKAAREILAARRPVLLKGITGSGKTEVYLDVIAHGLKAKRQALILLPEIALTAAFLQRFEARFGFAAGHWHSDMSDAARREIWHQVATGEIKVVIGARSALFLPFQSLGLIVVDEEHDRGYKQEEGVIYNGRDMAVLRAHCEDARLVLASATPSIESMLNAQSGRYQRVDLEERFGRAELPQTEVIDMRQAGLQASEFLSPHLISAVRARMSRLEQSLLFLNRRGYAPLTLCRACGHQLACPNCDARLVEHKGRDRLECHQCDFQMRIPKTCPKCDAEDRLVPVGPGVERLAEEVGQKIPEARICVLSSDLMQDEASLRQALRAIENGDYDVIIGTQMVAKGHNFPELTLVGIVDADIGLEGGDLRGAESSFQILRQVSGRAGRFEKPGLALIQSYQPDHPILRAILDPDDRHFYHDEIARRERALAPPFSRYIAIIIWAGDPAEAYKIGRDLLASSGNLTRKSVQIWGPALAPISRIRGRSRVRLLLKMPKSLALHEDVRDWVHALKIPARVKIQIDVDPLSFM